MVREERDYSHDGSFIKLITMPNHPLQEHIQYVADEMNEDGAILLGAVWGGDLGNLTNDFISFSGTCMNAAAGNWDKSATPYWRQLAQHWGNGSDGVGSEVILYNNT